MPSLLPEAVLLDALQDVDSLRRIPEFFVSDTLLLSTVMLLECSTSIPDLSQPDNLQLLMRPARQLRSCAPVAQRSKVSLTTDRLTASSAYTPTWALRMSTLCITTLLPRTIIPALGRSNLRAVVTGCCM